MAGGGGCATGPRNRLAGRQRAVHLRTVIRGFGQIVLTGARERSSKLVEYTGDVGGGIAVGAIRRSEGRGKHPSGLKPDVDLIGFIGPAKTVPLLQSRSLSSFSQPVRPRFVFSYLRHGFGTLTAFISDNPFAPGGFPCRISTTTCGMQCGRWARRLVWRCWQF